ncbi:metal ABC transporter permease [Marinomonas arenicola]|uniref:Metal ABC transporter permease n=1 Tax=Marinomonas arenicola TaxID=569601 RepID=A0ABU9G6D6_9GAMM
MTFYLLAIAPFHEYGFMRRALVAIIALALCAGPIGVLLLLRRMSLVGDSMSHAVLPGAAIGFIIAGGLSLPMMGAGALIAGLIVATLAGIVSRHTALKEDASFASFYLPSLALGVILISVKGSNIDLLHVLFGSILSIDSQALYLIGSITSFSLLLLAIIYRPLVVECFDPRFLRSVGAKNSLYHALFLLMVVLNLVAGFQTLGTLMAVGMMMLPAVIAQLWAKTLPKMICIATSVATLCGYIGLLISYHFNFSSGPTVVLTVFAIYLFSLIFAPAGIFYKHLMRRLPSSPMEKAK